MEHEYDETYSQLRRRLPLGTRVRHEDGWEGTVVSWEYGQVGIKVTEGTTSGSGNGKWAAFDGRIRFCYGRNVIRAT
jgi:hypothetical protein